MDLKPVITNARLRTSVTFYTMPDPLVLTNAIQKLGASALLSAVTAIGAAVLTATKESVNTLGSLRNFSRDQTRTVTKRYSLGINSFEAFQVIPGPITTKLTLERVILYKNDALKQVFGFWGENLASQQIPMLIVETKAPAKDDITETAVILYTNCWMTTNPIEYDIDQDDLLVVQDREIEVGKVIVVDSTLNGIAQGVDLAINIGKTIEII